MIDGQRNCLLEETKHSDLMIEMHKKMCKTLSYFESFLIFISVVSGCVSISAFDSLVGFPVGILSFTVRLKLKIIKKVNYQEKEGKAQKYCIVCKKIVKYYRSYDF